MLLGILLHACTFYVNPDLITELAPNEDITPISASLAVEVLYDWIHLWRMPAFFILAGFFSHLVLRRKGYGYFIKDRAIRIGLTLVIFSVGFGLVFGQNLAELGHLWFLYYLVIFYVLFIPISAGVDGLARRGLHWNGYKGACAFVFANPWRLMLLIMPVVVLTYYCRWRGMSVIAPETIFDPQPKALIYYLFFFYIGAVFGGQTQVMEQLVTRRVITVYVSLAVTSFIAAMCLRHGFVRVAPTYHLQVISSFAACVSLFTSFGFIGICGRYFNKRNKAVTYLVNLSYPTYVFHMTFVISIGLTLIDIGLDQHIAIVLNTLATFLICFAIYELIAKRPSVNWLFNGVKR